jgi:hypothetical protein
VAAVAEMATLFQPIRPVPPMTTIFMVYPFLSTTGAPQMGSNASEENIWAPTRLRICSPTLPSIADELLHRDQTTRCANFRHRQQLVHTATGRTRLCLSLPDEVSKMGWRSTTLVAKLAEGGWCGPTTRV